MTPQMVEQAIRGVLDQLQHFFETVATAIVRIGNIGYCSQWGKRQEAMNPVIVTCRTNGMQIGFIVTVHRNHIIELFEIVRCHSACALLTEIEAVSARGFLGAQVRWLANVIGMCSGRIDMYSVFQSGLGHLLTEHAFGCR